MKKLCKCGCGQILTNKGSYITGHNGKKGLTYEEYYGKEKAKIIKEKQSKARSFINQGKTWEEMFGEDKAKLLRQQRRETQFNKSFEEQFGKEKAKLIKEKISKNSKGKNSSSFVERFGKERAIIEKQKRSEPQKGRKGNIGNQNDKKTREKISLTKSIPKEDIIKKYKELVDSVGQIFKNEWNDYAICNSQTVRNKFGSLDELAKQADIDFKKAETGKFGKNETFILDRLEKERIVSLERQKTVKINNKIRFYLDGYDYKNNVVYEIDERHHKFRKIKDDIRDKLIKEKLNCNIIRINELTYLRNIGQSKLEDFQGIGV